MQADKQYAGYRRLFAAMRRACSEPDGEFVPYAVLRICVQNRVPFPLWAAQELLKHGDRLLRIPTQRGHNARPIDRDDQRTIDELRYTVVEKFRRTEKLSWRDAIERAVEYLGTTMRGNLLGHNGRRFPIHGETKTIQASYAREAKRRKSGKVFPTLRPD
jgi:hypothetical protein